MYSNAVDMYPFGTRGVWRMFHWKRGRGLEKNITENVKHCINTLFASRGNMVNILQNAHRDRSSRVQRPRRGGHAEPTRSMRGILFYNLTSFPFFLSPSIKVSFFWHLDCVTLVSETFRLCKASGTRLRLRVCLLSETYTGPMLKGMEIWKKMHHETYACSIFKDL